MEQRGERIKFHGTTHLRQGFVDPFQSAEHDAMPETAPRRGRIQTQCGIKAA
jgi:hypothetical protein